MNRVIVAEPQAGYWQDTDRQIIISTRRDQMAARSTNAAFRLVNITPFGSRRVTS